jgi:hypothetical protein
MSGTASRCPGALPQPRRSLSLWPRSWRASTPTPTGCWAGSWWIAGSWRTGLTSPSRRHGCEGAIRALEAIGYLERGLTTGSTHKATEEGLRRKPIRFVFGPEYAPLFMAANKRVRRAKGSDPVARRALAPSAAPRLSTAILKGQPLKSPKHKSEADNQVYLGELSKEAAFPLNPLRTLPWNAPCRTSEPGFSASRGASKRDQRMRIGNGTSHAPGACSWHALIVLTNSSESEPKRLPDRHQHVLNRLGGFRSEEATQAPDSSQQSQSPAQAIPWTDTAPGRGVQGQPNMAGAYAAKGKLPGLQRWGVHRHAGCVARRD